MDVVIPDFLGMSLDDIQLKINELPIGISLVYREYLPQTYKCWGKVPLFTKRVIRQKLLDTGILEIIVSDFIEHP